MADKKYTTVWSNQFFYMCHVDNLKSVLELGILSHNKILEKGLKPAMISNPEIVANRKTVTVEGKSLWDYANVYFRVKNAMHYRVMKSIGADKVVILCLKKDILKLPGAMISNGNAAVGNTSFFKPKELKNVLNEISKSMRMEWWNPNDESKSQTMAECLVPDEIPLQYISKIIVLNHDLKAGIEKEVSGILRRENINLISQVDFFNFPTDKTEVTSNINLIEGDMFFSNMQTLTVSVNLEGVMGKGLASAVKYIMPDVYVRYQEVLRTKELDMGKPYYYKRGKNINETLGEEDYVNGERPTCFLIFATKDKWRFTSDFKGIEEGLKYLVKNYKSWEIESLAFPALGCGNGWLLWENVGPMMIKYLKQMDIPIEIYLPREKPVPKEQKTKDFLLKNN